MESAERDGVQWWDIVLDGARRRAIRFTLILDPSLGMVAYVHYAPPLADSLRRIYRQMLHWSDELPFVKFGLADEERVVLSSEIPAGDLDTDALGLTVARLVAVCDLLYEESARWIDRVGPPAAPADDGAGVRLLERYARQLAELS